MGSTARIESTSKLGNATSRLLCILLFSLTVAISYRVVNNQIELYRAALGEVPAEPYNFVEANQLVLKNWLNKKIGTVDKISAISNEIVAKEPYWGTNWYLKSSVEAALGKRSDSLISVSKSVELWPTRGKLLRGAAEVLSEIGETEKAVSVAERAFWSRHVPPYDPLNLIFSSEIDSSSEVDRLLNHEENDIYGIQEDYLPALYWYAANSNRYEVLRKTTSFATWPNHKDIINNFALFAIKHGKSRDLYETRLRLWGDDSGYLVDGGFELEQIEGNVAWSYPHDPENVISTMDTRVSQSGLSSLKIHFRGQENVNLIDPSQYIPLVDSAKKYRVSGFWKGQNVTTRNKPVIELWSVKGNDRKIVQRIESNNGTWDWSKFEIYFENIDDSDYLFLRVRRFASNDLDSKISGSIWLDHIVVNTDDVKERFN